MNPSDVARRFERRYGYDLIDYAEVALPLYRLTVDAITMVHHEISPIKEFMMRSIAIGLDTAAEIGDFLGIDNAIVTATLDQLRDDRYATGNEETKIALTARGHDVLAKAKESSPQDEMLVFLYDRLTLKPVRLPPEQLLAPSNVDSKRTIEIRPYPAEGPDIDQIGLPDVLQVLTEQAGGRGVFGRDLLRLKRIVRRVRLYRPGVALVYKKVRSSEIQIAFIVDESETKRLSTRLRSGAARRRWAFFAPSTNLPRLRTYVDISAPTS
jgi:hypothetical protein